MKCLFVRIFLGFLTFFGNFIARRRPLNRSVCLAAIEWLDCAVQRRHVNRLALHLQVSFGGRWISFGKHKMSFETNNFLWETQTVFRDTNNSFRETICLSRQDEFPSGNNMSFETRLISFGKHKMSFETQLISFGKRQPLLTVWNAAMYIYHLFRWYTTFESKTPAERFQNFRQSYVLSPDRFEIH